MGASSKAATEITFDFDFYRFNGKGVRPSLVAMPDQASFMRSRYSIEGTLLDLATERARQWAKDHGMSVSPKQPFPSNQSGKYWLELRFGGLTI